MSLMGLGGLLGVVVLVVGVGVICVRFVGVFFVVFGVLWGLGLFFVGVVVGVVVMFVGVVVVVSVVFVWLMSVLGSMLFGWVVVLLLFVVGCSFVGVFGLPFFGEGVSLFCGVWLFVWSVMSAVGGVFL